MSPTDLLLVAAVAYALGAVTVLLTVAVVLLFTRGQAVAFRDLLRLAKSKHPEQLKAYTRAEAEGKKRPKPKAEKPPIPPNPNEIVEVHDWEKGSMQSMMRREAESQGIMDYVPTGTFAR